MLTDIANEYSQSSGKPHDEKKAIVSNTVITYRFELGVLTKMTI